MKKILITTGGTGGHVIPAKIIEEHLFENYEIYFSTDVRGLKYLSLDMGRVTVIDTPKLNFNILFPIKIIKVIYLIIYSIFLLKKKKIEKVISIGGYMSIPVVIGAKISGIPIILIEPNLVLGRGNKFFLNYSKKILCYSNKLLNFPKKHLSKIEVIKPLVSKAFYELKKSKDINSKFCFLISGGSQGAQIFDELLQQVMLEVSKEIPIKVIQQTKIENIKYLKNFYDINNIENKIFNFEDRFIDFINMSDLCITRAGATSLAEISILNKPFIAVPLPTAKDNHQMENAKFYEEIGCCWIIDQNTINKEKLLSDISSILKDRSKLILKKTNLEKLNYENSWNEANHKIKEIIDEN